MTNLVSGHFTVTKHHRTRVSVEPMYDVRRETRNTRNAGKRVMLGRHSKHISIKGLDLRLRNTMEKARLKLCT